MKTHVDAIQAEVRADVELRSATPTPCRRRRLRPGEVIMDGREDQAWYEKTYGEGVRWVIDESPLTEEEKKDVVAGYMKEVTHSRMRLIFPIIE